MTKPTLDQARAVLQAQPFSTMLGTVITEYSDDTATLELEVRPDFLQQHGYIHGGLLCYLADNALTFAAGRVLGPEILTSGVTLNYLRPAQGERLIARASAQGATAKTAVTLVEISAINNDGEYLCAVGSGTSAKRG